MPSTAPFIDNDNTKQGTARARVAAKVTGKGRGDHGSGHSNKNGDE